MGKKHEASLREIIPFTMFRSPWMNNRIAAQDFRRSTIAAVARILQPGKLSPRGTIVIFRQRDLR